MRRSLLLLALLTACAGPATDPALVLRGPLPTRNQHPFALTLHHPRPRRAVTQPSGTTGIALDLAYSSIFEIQGEPGELVYMDGETARGAARVRRGLDARTDLEFEVAATYASSGFLDAIIEDFHDLTGLPNQGREDFENDQFGMRLRRNGSLLFEVEEDRLQLADLAVTLTRSLRDEDQSGPAVAMRGAIELPTGSVEHGSSNGGVDLALGSVAERSLGRWTLFGSLDLLLPDDPETFDEAGVELRDMLSAQFGVEYRWSDCMSLLGQLVWTSPMTRDFTFEEFDREILDVAIGLAWDGPLGARYYAALEEDAISATGPDFGLLMGMSWGF
jgi:hypothetical protein